MNPTISRLRNRSARSNATLYSPGLRAVSCALILTLPSLIKAQTVDQSNTGAPADSTQGQVIELSPFTVTADKGYVATDSLAGSRVRTNLKDLAAPISAVTKDFMDDLGVTNMQEVITFIPGAENAAQAIDPAGLNGDSDLIAPNTTRVRGLAAATITRNYFESDIRLDNYNSSRIDVARGPNSILFGLGSPAGVINQSPDQAVFATMSEIGSRFDSHGSMRFNLMHNQELVDQKLAFRVAGLHTEEQVWRKPSMDRQNRYYLATRVQPFKNTTINASYENYENYISVARNVLVQDHVSPWIAAGRPGVASVPTAALTSAQLAALTPQGLYQDTTVNPVYISGSLNPNPQQLLLQTNTIKTLAAHLMPGADSSFRLSVPESVLPLDINIAGPSSSAWLDGRIFTTSIEQRVGGVNFELAYNNEQSHQLLMDLGSGGVPRLLADPNLKLANGAPNPDFGRFYIEQNPRIVDLSRKADTLRLTASYEADFTKKKAWLGRHQFTALGILDKSEEFNNTAREFISSNHSFMTAAVQGDLFNVRRAVFRRYYIDDPYNPRGGNTSAVVDQVQLNGQVVDANGVPIVSDPFRVGRVSNIRQRLETESVAGVWQGYFWKDRIVTTLGVRRDAQDVYRVDGQKVGGTGIDRNLFLRAQDMSEPPLVQAESGNTSTKGIAFHAFPWMSLYFNEADSFSLSAGAVDLYGNPLPGAKGEGRDYSVAFRALSNRLNLRITRYETSQVGDLGVSRSFVRFNYHNIETAIASDPGAVAAGDVAKFIPPEEVWETQDTDAKGYELEATFNPSSNWRIAFNATKQSAVNTNVALKSRAYLDERLATWLKYDTLAIGGSTSTVGDTYRTSIKPALDLAVATDGASSYKISDWRFNLLTNYIFPTDTILRGFSVGGSVRWVGAPIIGYDDKVVDGQSVLDVSKPFFGAEQFIVGLSVGYKTKVMRKYTVSLQLNVDNLIDGDQLYPVRQSPVTLAKSYQLRDPRLIRLSASMRF